MIDKKFHKLFFNYQEISIRYDVDSAAIWCYLNPQKHPCYTLETLKELHHLQLAIVDYFNYYKMKPKTDIRYFILASQTEGIFNYGGDLELFSQLIIKQDRKGLNNYAQVCIDVLYLQSKGLNLPITTIALLEGTTLGGGFEAALACDVIIAEENCKIGLPEIRYNLIPGVGAYSLLARKIGTKETEKMLSSGKIYSAQELHEKDIVTLLSKPTQGKEALDSFIQNESSKFNGMQAIRSARRVYNNLDYLELLDISKVWVESSLKLSTKDLKTMKQLAKVQSTKDISKKSRTKQDRRVSQQPLSFPFSDYSNNIISGDRRISTDRRA